MTDERYNRPSCSSFAQLEACPWSWKAQQGKPDETNEDAAAGDRVHLWLAEKSVTAWEAMSGAEQDHAELMDAQANRLAEEYLDEFEFIPIAEQRIIMTRGGTTCIAGADGIKPLPPWHVFFSGKFDRLYQDGRRGLIVDFKSGRGEYDAAADNAQLRGLAAIVADCYGLTECAAAIVQPFAGKPTVAEFNQKALTAAWDWSVHIVERAEDAKPEDASAGVHCHYCRAKVDCPTFRAYSQEPAETLQLERLPADPENARAALYARAMEIDAASLGQILDRLQALGWLISAAQGAAKRRIEAGERIPGAAGEYVLKHAKGKRSLKDVAKVWPALAAIGVTPEEFAAACSSSISAVEPLVRKRTGLKGRALEARVAEIVDPGVTVGAGSVQLECRAVPGDFNDEAHQRRNEH